MDSYSYRCVWENLHEFICATCLQSLARPEECIGPSGKSSRWLWATMWVLGIQYRSSAKETSVHNHGAAYSAQYFTFESYSENLRASWPPLSSCQLWRTFSLFGGYKASGAFALRTYLLLLQIQEEREAERKRKHKAKTRVGVSPVKGVSRWRQSLFMSVFCFSKTNLLINWLSLTHRHIYIPQVGSLK